MELTEEQRKAFRILSKGFDILYDCWTEELCNELASHGMLPARVLEEVSIDYAEFARLGVIPD